MGVAGEVEEGLSEQGSSMSNVFELHRPILPVCPMLLFPRRIIFYNLPNKGSKERPNIKAGGGGGKPSAECPSVDLQD